MFKSFALSLFYPCSSHQTLVMSPFLIAFVFQDVSASFNSIYSKLWAYSGDNLVICEIWIFTRWPKRKEFQFISIFGKQYTVIFRLLGLIYRGIVSALENLELCITSIVINPRFCGKNQVWHLTISTMSGSCDWSHPVILTTYTQTWN